VGVEVLALCASDDGLAYALGEADVGGQSLFSWDGSAWQRRGSMPGLLTAGARCLPGGVWIFTESGIASFAGGSWHSPVPRHLDEVGDIFWASNDRLFGATSSGLLAFDGAEWTLDSLEALSPGAAARVVVTAVGGTGPRDISLAVAFRELPAADRRFFVHHDGERIDRWMTDSREPETVAVIGLAPDDTLFLDRNGGLTRVQSGLLTVLHASDSMGFERGSFTSIDDGWAVAAGQLLRFDGSVWTRVDLSLSRVGDVHAFAADDVWVVGGSDLAHFDGSAWSVERLPSSAERVGGTSAEDLWVTNEGGLNRRVGTTWELVPLGAAGERIVAAGGSSNDLWLVVAHFDGHRLVHYDGAAFVGFAAPSAVTDVREIDGRTYARASDGTTEIVWERDAGHWVERRELDVEATFPSFGTPYRAVTEADGTLWSAEGEIIIRRDPRP
jgi:hypothetical protein